MGQESFRGGGLILRGVGHDNFTSSQDGAEFDAGEPMTAARAAVVDGDALVLDEVGEGIADGTARHAISPLGMPHTVPRTGGDAETAGRGPRVKGGTATAVDERSSRR